MAIFNSYVTNYQRAKPPFFHATTVFSGPCPSDPRAKWQTAETRRVAGAFYPNRFRRRPRWKTLEIQWKYMEFHLKYGYPVGNIWTYMEIYGNRWTYMAIFDVSIGGKFKGNHGYSPEHIGFPVHFPTNPLRNHWETQGVSPWGWLAGWLISWNTPLKKRMMTGGSLDFRKPPHMENIEGNQIL